MPRDDGSIPPVTVPALPWKQEFKPGDRVRVIACAEIPEFEGKYGTVTAWFETPEPCALVALQDARDPGAYFTPGELRPATA